MKYASKVMVFNISMKVWTLRIFRLPSVKESKEAGQDRKAFAVN